MPFLGASTSTGASEEWSISIASSAGGLEMGASSSTFAVWRVLLAKVTDFPVVT